MYRSRHCTIDIMYRKRPTPLGLGLGRPYGQFVF